MVNFNCVVFIIIVFKCFFDFLKRAVVFYLGSKLLNNIYCGVSDN